MSDLKKADGEKGKVLVHVLVAVFGVTSWSIMNGLWVELPILVAHLPEGWTLPSYLTIISQFGNLGPLAFVFLTWLFPKTKLETPVSILVVIVLSVCAALYGVLWKETAVIGGLHLSVAILALTLCQAIFAATSSMSYLAFMSHLKARYISSIFIGQGLSGLLPAFIAIGQGAGDVRCITNLSYPMEEGPSSALDGRQDSLNDTTVIAMNTDPRFSVQTFFLALFVMGLMSLASLITLVKHPYCRTEHVNTDLEDNCQLMLNKKEGHRENSEKASGFTRPEESKLLNDTETMTSECLQMESFPVVMDTNDNNSQQSQLSPDVMLSTDNDSHGNAGSDAESHPNRRVEDHRQESSEAVGRSESSVKRWESWFLLGLLVWINFLQTSYVLAIQVYSSLPYGLAIYHGVTKAENIVDPLACVVTLFVTAQRTKVISGLTLLGSLFAAYIITVAAMSPHPFLVNETMGGVLVITAWIMCTVLMVYSKVSIATVMRNQGRKSLIWTGGSSQLGALIGAILAYVMINQLDLFKDGPWC